MRSDVSRALLLAETARLAGLALSLKLDASAVLAAIAHA